MLYAINAFKWNFDQVYKPLQMNKKPDFGKILKYYNHVNLQKKVPGCGRGLDAIGGKKSTLQKDISKTYTKSTYQISAF